MDLKEQLVIWKKAEFLLDNLAWTPRLQDQLVEQEVLTAEMVADIHSFQYNVERKLRFLTLLGTNSTDVYRKFLRALEHSEHGALVKDIQRTYKLTKFGEMLPPSFSYFLDMSDFLRLYPHIGLKLGEDGKHLLQTYIEGKIQIEIRKHHEHLKTLEATNVRLVEEMRQTELRMTDARDKQLAAEALWATSGGRIDELKSRITALEAASRDDKREIRHMKHFYKIHNDLEVFLEEGYTEFVPLEAASVTGSDLDSSRSARGAVSGTERQRFHLLQSQVGLNMVRLDLIRTSLQNLTREERRVQEVAHSIAKTDPADVDDGLRKEVSTFLKEIQQTRSQLETQLDDGEQDLALHERELAEKEKQHESPAEITVWTHTDLVGKLQATIENMKRAHNKKMREQKIKHEREIDTMIERIQKMNQKHMEDVDKLKGTIRKKMFEIQKREQLHKKLRGQIRVMENYQSRNMNATVSVEQCRKIVRAIIGEARILRDIADEREIVVQQAEEEAERKMEKSESKGKAGKKGKGKKGKGNKGKKKKIPESLNEERLRYLADKIKWDWRQVGSLLELTDNRLDIVEMDAGSGSAERIAYCMLRVWRDEEAGRPVDVALALLQLGHQQLATLFVPLSKLLALKQAREAGSEGEEEEEGGRPGTPGGSNVPSLPAIHSAA